MSDKVLARVLAIIVGICALTLSLRGLLSFPTDWDFLAYHLPFALRHYGLTSFQPNEMLMVLYDAFPPIAHLVQGALIVLLSNPSAAALLNGFGFFISLLVLRSLYPQLSIPQMLLAILAMPVVLFQIGSGYIDLWVATWIWIAFVASVKFIEDGCNSWKTATAIFLGLGVAAGSKYQAWPFCAVIILFLVTGMLAARQKDGGRRSNLSRNITILAVATLCAAAWPIRNLVKFGNPTYPLQPPIISKFLKFEGMELGLEERKGQVPQYLWSASNPRMFVESALELNRLQASQEDFKYSIDQGGYSGGPSTPHHRMGGWSYYVVVGCLFFGLWRWLIEIRDARKLNSLISASMPFGVVILCTLILLLIPQNHELRYWTFLPLFVIFLIFKPLSSPNSRYSKALLIYFLVAFAITNFNLKEIYRLRRVSAVQYYSAEAQSSVEQMRKSGVGRNTPPICISTHLPWDIYWAGKNFNEVAVKVCKQ